MKRKGEGAEIFGLAAGGSDDWAHMSGIPISFTIELRDTGSFGFLLPESQIKPTCEENMKGVEAVFDHVKPLNSCDDAACSGDCWYHKSDRLFKCFAPSGKINQNISFPVIQPDPQDSGSANSDLSVLYSILFIYFNIL